MSGPCGKTDVPVFLAEECSVVEEMQRVFRMYFTQVRSAVLSLLHTDRRTDIYVYSLSAIHILSYQSAKAGCHECINITFP